MRVHAVVADELGAVDTIAGGGLRVLAAVALLLAAGAAYHANNTPLYIMFKRQVRPDRLL